MKFVRALNAIMLIMLYFLFESANNVSANATNLKICSCTLRERVFIDNCISRDNRCCCCPVKIG